MNPKAIVSARLVELRKEDDEVRAQRGAIVDGALAEKRGLNDTEQASHDALTARHNALVEQIGMCEARIVEIDQEEARTAAANASRAQLGDTGPQTGGAQVTDPPVYRKNDVTSSYFRDLYMARKTGDREAVDRLRRSDAQTMEKRALSTGTGAGGEFAPPLWLVDQFVALARPGRVFADSLHPSVLPAGISSVNVPRVATGSSTAVQATQNSAVSQTDLTTNSVSSGIVTIAGKQVVAQQLLDQSGIPFDEVILADLAADYAKQFDNQVISGSGASGQLNGVSTFFTASGTNNVTYTSTTPTTQLLYKSIGNAIQKILTTRFMPPDVIYMHPRRWYALLSDADTTGRPLVLPQGSAYNALGTAKEGPVPEGAAGVILGLPVIVDPNLPTNIGAGTNQDNVYVARSADLRLWETSLRAEAFDAPYADSVGILFRAFAYSAAIPGRYTTSVSVISGTGLVAPTF